VSFTGLSLSSLLTLFGALGGGMVLLYILKLRRRRVEVAFSPLWARVLEERQSSSLFKKLKRFFSLLVQLAILGAFVLALGDPQLTGAGGCYAGKPEAPPERHTLILLDGSASMRTLHEGSTRAERAAKKAHELIDQLGRNPNHHAMLVQVDASARPLSLWTADRKALHAAIDAYSPLDTPTDTRQALELARSATRGRLNAETVMVTDRAFEPIAKAHQEELRLKLIDVGEPVVLGNLGLLSFNVRPYLDDSLSYAIFYAVQNETDQPLEATLFLHANDGGQCAADFVERGQIVTSLALTLPPRGVLEGVLDHVQFEGDRLLGRVAVSSASAVRDAFAGDDAAFALVPERKKLKVQLVTEGNLFLHATLFVRENVDFTVVAPGAYQGPEGYDVTVVDGAKVDLSRPGNYFVVGVQPDGPFKTEGTTEDTEIKKLHKEHPMARHLKLADLAVQEMPVVIPARGDKLVAVAAQGRPLVFTREDAQTQRRFAVISFDLKGSLFPLNYAFPLLVVNVLNWFYQAEEGLLKPNRAGVELSLALEVPADGPLIVDGPVGTAVRARRVADRVHLSAPLTGIYEIGAEGDPGRVPVAVNLMSAEESRIAPRGEYPAWEAPPPWNPSEHFWLDHLWRACLVVALGILAIEWLTYHRRVTV
jgi:hypothetical protein